MEILIVVICFIGIVINLIGFAVISDKIDQIAQKCWLIQSKTNWIDEQLCLTKYHVYLTEADVEKLLPHFGEGAKNEK